MQTPMTGCGRFPARGIKLKKEKLWGMNPKSIMPPASASTGASASQPMSRTLKRTEASRWSAGFASDADRESGNVIWNISFLGIYQIPGIESEGNLLGIIRISRQFLLQHSILPGRAIDIHDPDHESRDQAPQRTQGDRQGEKLDDHRRVSGMADDAIGAPGGDRLAAVILQADRGREEIVGRHRPAHEQEHGREDQQRGKRGRKGNGRRPSEPVIQSAERQQNRQQ